MPTAWLQNLAKDDSNQVASWMGVELPGMEDLDWLHKPSNKKWKEIAGFMPMEQL
jgi:predicted neuraminidase